MGDGELKEPWGTRGRGEQEGALVERSGLSRRTWKGSGGADRREDTFPWPSGKQKLYCYKVLHLGSCLDIPQQLLGVV